MNEPEKQPENANEVTTTDLADLEAMSAQEITGGDGGIKKLGSKLLVLQPDGSYSG